MRHNSDVEADVALAALVTSLLAASRYGDRRSDLDPGAGADGCVRIQSWTRFVGASVPVYRMGSLRGCSSPVAGSVLKFVEFASACIARAWSVGAPSAIQP